MKLDTTTNGMLFITLNEDECNKLKYGSKDIKLISRCNTVICGGCNAIINSGISYYIPCLNEVYCEECFNDIQKGMTHYDDICSINFEQRHCNIVLKTLDRTARVKWNCTDKKFDKTITFTLHDIED